MQTMAIVLEQPEHIVFSRLELTPPGDEDVVVDIDYSGISTGTEKLLFNGRMPAFPGMGYPLVPGYESVGRIVAAGPGSPHCVGERVFVPGARCYGEVRGLFGGAASKIVVGGTRVVPVSETLGEQAVLLALAATAYHAVSGAGKRTPIVPPDLIVGHGVLGRLLARMTVVAGFTPPTVWETNPTRATGAQGYAVVDPAQDARRDYRAIYDVSGDSQILDHLVRHLAPGGEIVLAGFYTEALHFNFAPAFMREAQIRCAAEWQRPDLLAVTELAESGRLSLADLITHHDQPTHADAAYRTAFGDPGCLKMVLDWRSCQ
ncbi:MAG: chlorophyll synthesis pathway protein BchC [Rubrivivax sp.]|jgi:3-hydroxyethyl bacteriochlorophyllide a dehydrogenase|nr:chlorophyll synthesis pathway protein BchC [Betaproteobacteria bacterium]MBP6318485.1 chlorophyll synthesis pathway protein BchC [Rubrivivax sp.]MBK7278386.1 chlorophyll synthesis pathway protein BchC [Betaproteobacteria bacterium]MBK7460167.1 chlorophyll synthesis pathway protein BchC [Betaproteobacteria bacterium]MBK7515138.1 chlorophyll synthesis pathway protein BchC [Betaproteobacteria bacterium]